MYEVPPPQQPPSPREPSGAALHLLILKRAPLAGAFLFACVVLTLVFWFTDSPDPKAPPGPLEVLIAGSAPITQRPWTLFTTIFLHGNMAHIVLNLMAWWYIAPRIEILFGHLRLLWLSLILAIVPNLIEIAFGHQVIGISGVIYGLFAFAWFAQKRDARYAGAVDPRVMQSLVVSFFICIVLTFTKIMPIGNIAHGVGAAMGALIAILAIKPHRLAARV